MKKFFAIALMMVAAIAVSAQEVESDGSRNIVMNRTFSVGGKALMCTRSAKIAKEDLKPLTWTLESRRIGDENFIKLKVDNMKTGLSEAYQTWSDNAVVIMRINAKGEKSYFVVDDMFCHLKIVDLGKGVSAILLYSELKESFENVEIEN